MHSKAPREQHLQNNHKHGSRPTDFNKNKDKSKNTGPPQEKIPRPCPKANSVQFEDPYDHIRHMDHIRENTHPIDTQEQFMENNEFENMNSITRLVMTLSMRNTLNISTQTLITIFCLQQ